MLLNNARIRASHAGEKRVETKRQHAAKPHDPWAHEARHADRDRGGDGNNNVRHQEIVPMRTNETGEGKERWTFRAAAEPNAAVREYENEDAECVGWVRRGRGNGNGR